MVRLNKIYTKTGDKGRTRLATGESVKKSNQRLNAYGTVDECNAFIGVARHYSKDDKVIDEILARIQNDMFDLGSDLATPDDPNITWTPTRIVEKQVERLEKEIDMMNAMLDPLDSFVLPAGTELSAHLHVARTVCRRAEREVAELIEQGEYVSPEAAKFINRLSDLLFVAARRANQNGALDVKWVRGGNT